MSIYTTSTMTNKYFDDKAYVAMDNMLGFACLDKVATLFGDMGFNMRAALSKFTIKIPIKLLQAQG